MIVDAVEDFGQPGLPIVAVHLGCLDKGDRPGQRFATAVGACKKSVLSLQCAFVQCAPLECLPKYTLNTEYCIKYQCNQSVDGKDTLVAVFMQ